MNDTQKSEIEGVIARWSEQLQALRIIRQDFYFIGTPEKFAGVVQTLEKCVDDLKEAIN